MQRTAALPAVVGSGAGALALAGLVARAGLALVLLSACALTRRFDPPALIQAEVVPIADALARYPEGTEAIELVGGSGASLRGVFVPSDPGAPVVLHLLDSSGSFARREGAPVGVASELADLGLASLIVDYTGVGHSAGERSVRNLRGDAHALWEEALRRAGGDPRRVIVRAVSLGTIPSALLLEDGARPGALVWILPVFPDTVARRFALWSQCLVSSVAAWAFLRPVAEVGLEEALPAAAVPARVIAAGLDELSSRSERARLAACVRAAGGTFQELELGHLALAARSRWILPEELELYAGLGLPDVEQRLARVLAELPEEVRACFPEGSVERERLRALAGHVRTLPALDVAAAAASPGEALDRARWLWSLRTRRYGELAFEDRVAAYSFDDPAGALPITRVELLSRGADISQEFAGLWMSWGAGSIAQASREASPGWASAPSISFSLGRVPVVEHADVASIFAEFLEKTGSWQAAGRWYARLLLKHCRIPDRVRPDGNGGWRVEALEEGEWKALDLAPAGATSPR